MMQQVQSFVTTMTHSTAEHWQTLVVVAAIYLGMGVVLWTLHQAALGRES